MLDDFTIFKTVVVIIILVLGTFGNILVVLVVNRRRKMRTVTNYFILNLAVADLTVLVSNIPIDVTRSFMQRWIFGKTACKIILPLQTMGTIASILTLVAISLSRYHAIVYPFKRQLKLVHARGIIVVIWTISLAGITPYFLACKYIEKTQQCTEDFSSIGITSQSYTLTMFVLQYVIPMIGMTYAYNRIGAELNQQQHSDTGSLMDPEYRRESRKVVKMLSIVVALFAILILPVHVVWIWIDFFNGSKEASHEYVRGFSMIMLYGNSFINPIIYSICNEQFRTGFKEVFGSFMGLCCFTSDYSENSKRGVETPSERQSRSRLSFNGNLVNQTGFKTQKYEDKTARGSVDPRPDIHSNNGQAIALVLCGSDIQGITRETDV